MYYSGSHPSGAAVAGATHQSAYTLRWVPKIVVKCMYNTCIECTGTFGLCECDRFGAPPKRLLGGVVGSYGAMGGLLALYFARAGGLGGPFLFKWGAAARVVVREMTVNCLSFLSAIGTAFRFL